MRNNQMVITSFRLVVGIVALLMTASVAAEKRAATVTLGVNTVDGQQVLSVMANDSPCSELREDLTQEDLDNPACIQTPAVASGGLELVWKLDTPKCVKGESGYTLREVMLADHRGEFLRPIQTRTLQDFRLGRNRPTMHTGEFRRKDTSEIRLGNANTAEYVVFYRLVGRNCATGEALSLEAPISIGGRSMPGRTEKPL